MASKRNTAATAIGRAQPDSSFIAELEEDLAIQRAILASLLTETLSPEIQDQIAQAKKEIADIRKRLAEARGTQSRDSFKTESSSSNPSTMSSPEHSRTATPSSFSRKRSFGNSNLGDAVTGRPDNKTRRSAAFTGSAFSSDDEKVGGVTVIDLTGDDDEVFKRQREAAERHRRNKELTELDRNMARQLAGDFQQFQSGGVFNQTSSLGQSNAFNRIRDYSGTSVKRSPEWPNPSPSKSQTGMVIKNEAGSAPYPSRTSHVSPHSPFGSGGAPSSSFPHINHGFPSAGSSAVKPESTSFNLHVKTGNNPLSGTPAYHVPGAWGNWDTDGFSVVGSFPSHSQPPQPPQPLSLPLPNRPVGLGLPTPSPFGPGSSIERARQSALVSQAGGSSSLVYPQYGVSQVGLTPPNLLSGASTPNRPGYLSDGSYLSASLPGYDSLSAIINRTSTYDWENMVDAYGHPLSSRLMGYVQDYVEDPRKTAEEIQSLLSNIRPDMDIPAEERGETPEALKYPLYAHQQLALKWMMDMEKGTNKGGILADDMGLGKTISALALMVSRKSSDSIKTNLIIGPVALIKQWELEIKKKLKASHKMSVYLLHQKKKISYQQMRNYDVVLTTYGSIASEWKQYLLHIDQRKAGDGYDPARDEELQKKCPLIHPRSRFYRVILDEAQCIKNKDTQGSKACHQIEATYRWCLTGTPMMNGVPELYPLIRFLRIRPYNIQKQFTEAFKGLTPKARVTETQKNDSLRKLQAVLKAIMLRRMKSSQIDGKPILTLPPKTKLEEYVVLSEDETKFYKDLEARSQVQFNKYLRQGTVGKNYSNILVLLLRLRQACCHPHLMDFECVGTNDVSEDRMLELANSLEEAVINRIKAIEAFECPVCYDAVEDPTLIIPCGHDTCSECFISLTDNAAQGNIRSGEENAQAKCPVCRGPAEPTKIINYTAFQKAHMPEKLPASEASASGLEMDTDTDSDFSSDGDDDDEADSDGNLRGFVVSDDAEDDEDDADDADDCDDDGDIDAELAAAAKATKPTKAAKLRTRKPEAKSLRKEPKQKTLRKPKPEKVQPHQLGALRQEAGKNKEARRRYMHYLRDNWEDSAKVTKVVELLEEIQETNEKTIIFSQWTSLLDLIECQIRYKLGLKYCRYTGAMSRQQRDDAVDDFVQNPRNTIMLVSLRAGNAGLNLTVASRIIICDPFWNPYIEMQAVDRAHRIGQQREVKVHRILVNETVEDRILQLQENKRALVEAALDEGQMKNLGRLSENELRYLFGVGGR